ncbi:phosphoenolpyruvate carboxylase [Sediminitomix flava]|uniref:Phosphoenolpyruvate carboxylase n=1 Tax=Sediminitomix flava TaxID=379075 RepID=A0A315Z959_SEDFL|nr:phosphoenolpyruvate carboxylase [Sediminitomix flava]PWJ40754.1 phosphoenolpyruvate carboxylase type 1 [Sediminitomix flava]
MNKKESKTTLEIIKEKVGKPYDDLTFLLTCLKEVLEENGEKELANQVPWVNANPSSQVLDERLIQLFSLCFQLLNTVEENGEVQNRRKSESKNGLTTEGLWGARLKNLKDAGYSEKEIAEHLKNITIEPVLTAHPTEAKRTTVLEHNRNMYLMMVKRENQMYSTYEQNQIKKEIKTMLDTLWQTGEIFIEKPKVSDELRNILYYLTNIFPTALPLLDIRLAQAWEDAGFDKKLIEKVTDRPKISFGDWVGGDRDGNPFVTDTVTKHTLSELRLNAIIHIRESMLELIKRLSYSKEYTEMPKKFIDRINEMRTELGSQADKALERNRGEAYRQFLGLCLLKLPIKIDNHNIELAESDTSYFYSKDLLNDLNLLQDVLIEKGARNGALVYVNNTIRVVDTFGFHLAKLDIRQNSSFHDKAITQLMNAAGIEGNFEEWNEEKRLVFLNNELQSNRPFSYKGAPLEKEAQTVKECYEVIADQVNKYGLNGIGALIVSMTRSVSDLLAVFVLCREVGLTVQTEEGLVCKLPVVPLFETIEDLQQSPQIMENFLDHPLTKRSLEYQRKVNEWTKPRQMIMVGYSDSNKDGGVIASQWSLFHSQDRLSTVAKNRGLHMTFFHGKGGSISRGAGPTHMFLESLPPSSVNGYMRLTEQGESIEQKYSNKMTACYNLELLAAGSAEVTIKGDNDKENIYPYTKTFSWMAEESKKTYVELLNHPNFIKYFAEATPIDAIESSRIGSRPARRTGKRTLGDLRAIPWVFSWSQSRCNLTSWYGVGSTLEKLKKEFPSEFKAIKDGVKKDPLLKYVFNNIDTSLEATDEDIMKAYSELVEDAKVKSSIFKLLSAELKKTRTMLKELLVDSFEARNPESFYTNKLRKETLDQIHYKQIDLLKKWRAMKVKGDSQKEEEQMLFYLLGSINAIATALRTTG